MSPSPAPRPLGYQIGAIVALLALVAGGRILAHKVLEPAIGAIPAALVVIAIAVAFCWLILVVMAGASLDSLGITHRGLGREIALGAAAAFALAAVLFGHLWLWAGTDVVADTWREMQAIDAATHLRFLLLGLAPAIGEELLFRGYLQPRLMKRLGFVGGWVLTAALFGGAHVHFWKWPPYLLANIFLIGLAYGILRGRDRSLVAPMVAHACTWAIWAGL